MDYEEHSSHLFYPQPAYESNDHLRIVLRVLDETLKPREPTTRHRALNRVNL